MEFTRLFIGYVGSTDGKGSRLADYSLGFTTTWCCPEYFDPANCVYQLILRAEGWTIDERRRDERQLVSYNSAGRAGMVALSPSNILINRRQSAGWLP